MCEFILESSMCCSCVAVGVSSFHSCTRSFVILQFWMKYVYDTMFCNCRIRSLIIADGKCFSQVIYNVNYRDKVRHHQQIIYIFLKVLAHTTFVNRCLKAFPNNVGHRPWMPIPHICVKRKRGCTCFYNIAPDSTHFYHRCSFEWVSHRFSSSQPKI